MVQDGAFRYRHAHITAIVLASGCAGSVVATKPSPPVATQPRAPAVAKAPTGEGSSPALPPADPPPLSSDRFREPPPLCQQVAQPLDPRGQQMLIALEGDLIATVLAAPGDPARDHHGYNVGEVGWNLHQHPQGEMVFLFPLAVPIPKTTFHVRVDVGKRMAQLMKLDHPVFYLELSGVHMVRAGADTGLIVDYGGGPAGKAVRGWGMWGRFCAVPGRGGGWVGYPVGSVVVALL